MNDDIRISKNFTVANWKELRKKLDVNTNNHWNEAVKVFQDRIDSRFLDPINKIKQNDLQEGEGFSIALISVVLLEFLASFEIGKIYLVDEGDIGPHQYKSSANLLNEFISNVEIFKSRFQNRECRDRFFSHIRCGLVHEARTKGNDVIISEDSKKNTKAQYYYFKEDDQYHLNRDLFLDTIKEYKNDYCNRLLDSKNGVELRRKFILKMDEVAGLNHQWYFIYGSNLSSEKLNKRLTSLQTQYLAKVKCTLDDYEFSYSKKGSKDGSAKGNIRYNLGKKTEGIVVLLLEHEIELFGLKYEQGYDLIKCNVTQGKLNFQALTFISSLTTNNTPDIEYIEEVLAGAREQNINADYITEYFKVDLSSTPKSGIEPTNEGKYAS